METQVSALARRPPLLATLVATVFGAGLLPVMPGTYGTLAAIPLAIGLDRLGNWAFLAGTLIVIVVGTIAADVYCRATGRHDNQQIVIDEVAGYLVTLLLVPRTVPNLIVAFVLFRVLDTWKPQPVRWIDRRVEGGLGVVADDVGAGIYGALCLWLLQHYGVLARFGV